MDIDKRVTAIERPQKGKWSEYWRTAVSYAGQHKILIRGYPLNELIENLSYTDILWLILKGELPTPSQSRVFGSVVCGIIDHYLDSATVTAARFVASANPQSPIPAIAAGILAMGSNTVSPQDTAELIGRGIEKVKSKGLTKEQAAGELVREYRMEGRRIPGLGHRLHPKGDPRAIAIKNVAVANGVWGQKCELYEAVQTELARSAGVSLPINVDGMMACVLSELDFHPLEMAGIAAISYMPGILAQVVEEILYGVPIRSIPEEHGAKYVGVEERHLSHEHRRTR